MALPFLFASARSQLIARSGRGAFFFDGGADEIAPFGPRTIVVLHVVITQQILEHEPGVGTAFADAAVGDDGVLAIDSLAIVERFEGVRGFEGAIFVGRLGPGDAGGAGNVAAALGGFAHARRRNDFSGEFVGRTDVHKLSGFLFFDECEYFIFSGAQRFVGGAGVIGGGSNLGGIGGQRTLFFHPLLATAIDEPGILVAVIFQLPQSVGGEPVVIVTVKKNCGVVGNAGLAQQLFEGGLVNQVAPHVILKLRLPVPADGAGNVALFVGGGVYVYFDEPNFGVVQMSRGPFG